MAGFSAPGCARGRRLLLWPQRADGRQRMAQQRRIFVGDQLERHLLERRWQLGICRHESVCGRSGGKPRAKHDGDLFI